MGIGSSRGDDRAVAAAEMAISSPLLEASIDGAHGVLLSIQGGSDLGLFEINEAAQLVSNSAAVDANIIFGAVIDDALGDEVRVTVIAAGFDEQQPVRRATPAVGYGASPATAAAGSPAASGSAAPAGPAASGGPAFGSSAAGGAPARSSGPSSWGQARPSSPGPSAGGASADAGGGSASRLTAPAPGTRGAGLPAHTPPAGIPAAGPVAEIPVQAGSQAPAAAYMPAPVAFVTGEEGEDEYASLDHDDYQADDGQAGDIAPSGWQETVRAAPDKSFDVSAPRRRPVVFEEDDDLDVPDFLK
jgi:cell division protein FtsZ